MKVLITGGTGFLGRHVVRELLARDLTVRCLTRPGSDTSGVLAAVPREARGRLEFFSGNLNRADSCAAAVDGCDVVYHAAAELTGATALLFLANVVATRRLIEGSLQANVRRFVLISSLGVYGTGHLRRWDCINEDCPMDPQPHRRDPYTFSKIAQEQAAWDAHRESGLPLVVVRPGVIYGPGRDCISGRMGLRLGKLLVQMGGRQRLPYTFVENCARAVGAAGLTPGIEGRAFNVVDNEPPTANELYHAYQRKVGGLQRVKVPAWGIGFLSGCCEWYHRWSRGQLPAVLTRYKSGAMWKPLHYSNERAKESLGWQSDVSFSRGLERTFAALRIMGSGR